MPRATDETLRTVPVLHVRRTVVSANESFDGQDCPSHGHPTGRIARPTSYAAGRERQSR
jgi:hypothetical protein